MNSPKLTRTTPKMPVPGPPIPWRRIVITVVMFAVLLAVGAMCLYVSSHAMPGVSLAEQKVAGKTLAEVEAMAQKSANSIEVTFSDGSTTLTPQLHEIGVSIDAKASAKAAFDARRGQDILGDIQWWQSKNIPLKVDVDTKTLQAYLAKTFAAFKAPVPPNLTYNAAVEQFDVVPGKAGSLFDIEAIAAKIQQSAGQPGALSFAASNQPVLPSISDTAAVHTQDEANKRLLLRLNLLYKDKLIYFPESSEMASWFGFAPSSDGTKLDIIYDKKRMVQFIQTKVAASLNTYFGPGSSDPLAGDETLKIAEPQALADDAVDALGANESMDKEIEVLGIGSNPAEVAP